MSVQYMCPKLKENAVQLEATKVEGDWPDSMKALTDHRPDFIVYLLAQLTR